ncbi:MAG: heme o synthase [Pseudomonadota bacterium]|nr:heme o synthase [Pseudomonadota bacterium]
MPLPKQALSQSTILSQWQDYLEVCKPRVVALMVFTALVGMLLAAPGEVGATTLVCGNLGIALVASSAAAINHMTDRHVDAVMARTRMRPLPTGHLEARHVLIFAAVLGVLGMAILIVYVNLLTAVLTFASLVGYAAVYTLFLKHATPQNIVIGGAAGATPPLLGWTAVTGHVDPNALLLFLIIFTWTPPHFWALALYRKDEYAKVNIPMLPVTHGEDYTRLYILLYTWLLVVITVLPFITGMAGLIYLIGALVLDALFLYYAIALKLTRRRALAIKTFVYSIIYLMLLFALLLFDRYLPILLNQF